MGIAGAGFGAAKALEDILAEQMVRAQLAQRQREQAERMQLERDQLAESQRQFDVRADASAADERQRRNITGIRRMAAEAITQNTGDLTDDDRRGLAALQIEAGDAPTMLNAPKVQRHAVTVNVSGKPVRKLLTEDELAQGVEEYREPKSTGGQANYLTLIDGNGNQQRVADGPQANQMLQQGWKIFDPVAARSSKPANNPEAVDTAREAKRLAEDLLSSKGFNGAFGVVGSMVPTVRQDTADAEIIRDSLMNMLTVESMDKMKGVLSDSDMKVLRSAATTLNGRMSEASARRELKRIIEVMGRVAGEGPTAGLPPMDLATSRGNAPAPSGGNNLYQQYLARKRGGQ